MIQQQHEQAQQAGNHAYAMTAAMGGEREDCADAYRAAYDATLAQLQAAAREVGVEAEWMAARTPTDAEFERMSAGKPDGIVEHDDWQEGHW